MFYELLKNCSKTCSFSVKNTGEFNFVNNNRCSSCVFNFEKTVCLDDGKKLSFKEFKDLIKFIESKNYSVTKTDISFVFMHNNKNNCDNENIISFLIYCIKNDIYKEYCLKKLKFKINERFFNVSKSHKSK